jgi:hypothetical protein
MSIFVLPGNDSVPSARDAYARTLLLNCVAEQEEEVKGRPSDNSTEIDVIMHDQPAPVPNRRQKIGIIGAGAAGLYATLLLESLGDFGYDYEILEADNKRIGGRLYTHHFDAKENEYYVGGPIRSFSCHSED